MKFIETAERQFGGAWQAQTLTGEEALEILLPPHAGEPCQGDRLTLVEPGGATVREVAQRLARVREAYQEANRTCWSRIEKAAVAPFSGIILTTAPLEADDYIGMTPLAGRLYHLDGFHRLIGWAWAGRLHAPQARIPAVVAGRL